MPELCGNWGHNILITTSNPCPCGYYGDPVKPCTCSSGTVDKYQMRISGPLLDRIDIHIEVPRVEYDKLSDRRQGEPSAAIQVRVESARQQQHQRFVGAKHTPEHDHIETLRGNASPLPVDGRQRSHSARPPGRGAAVSAQDDVGVKYDPPVA
jgi:hypothetical protein